MPEIVISTFSGSGTSTVKIVKPSDIQLHRGYVFYIKITVDGVNSVENPRDTTAYLGPYDLRIGCYADSVTFTNSASFVTSVLVPVGNSTIARYKFYEPSSNRAWCFILSNEIRDQSGNVLTDAAKIRPSADVTQTSPNTVFDLVSTAIPEDVKFTFTSHWPNSMTHTSPVATVSIYCGNWYSISAITTVTSPRYVSQNSGITDGFIIPKYMSS